MLRAASVALLLALAGCGGDGDSRSAVNAEPQDLPNGDARGATIISGAGCLACHRIGENGADGPGPDLTDVGARLGEDEIRETLLAGRSPMPSYRGMPAPDLRSLVDYLGELR